MRAMIAGLPNEARWFMPEPRRSLSATTLDRIVRSAFPRCGVLGVESLGDGLRNANFKLHLSAPPKSVVLRIYEHEPTLCQKEIDVLRLLAGSVPVPELLHAEPNGWEDLPPFTLARFVEGISFRQLARSNDRGATAEAAFSAGQTIAAIGRITFSKPGWIGSGLTVTPMLEGADALPRFIDACLASEQLRRRMAADICERVHAVVWKHASEVSLLERESYLVHGDFGKRNLLVRENSGRWEVAAVLDWEFAISGSPLCDVGHFLRYERVSRPVAEPHFSRGYLDAGAKLPEDWRVVARVLDMSRLCESLTREELPASVETELVELVRATIEDRDPKFS
jgi:aminoglycoside phosphotransferase (APT) family kinase protein